MVIMPYYVYKIEVDDKIYIGHTKDIKKRTYQHNYLFNKSPEKKEFYKALPKATKLLELEILYKEKTKADAKRREIYLILERYFNGEKLWQKIPNISDR